MKTNVRLAVLALLTFVVSACAIAPVETTPTEDPALRITHAVETVYAQITATAQVVALSATPTATPPPPTETPVPSTATPAFTETPFPTSPPTATFTASPAPASHCPLAQVTRQTLAPGTKVVTGKWLVQQWTVLNAGDCTWTTDYRVVYWDGTTFGLPLVKNFHQAVEPGGFIVITFEFAAPSTPGIYKSWWMMRDTNGEVFGNGPNDTPLYIEINVQEPD